MSRYVLSEHEQGTDGWRQDRAGKATSSNAACILAKGKTKGTEAVTRRNYRYRLALERVTGRVIESDFTNKHLERGNELEPFARLAYEASTCAIVREAGFAYLPDVAAGCSVDGFIEEHAQTGVAEFKCPIPAIHWDYMQRSVPPPEYTAQILHILWVTGLPFVDFSSYCDLMPEKLQLHTVRFLRDEAQIKAHEAEVLQFLAEVDELEQSIRRRAA